MKQLLRLAPIALVIGVVVPALTPSVVSASPVERQRERVENIVDELERLEEQANAIAEDYVEALDAKSLLDEEIVQLEADIAAKEGELADLRADLGDLAIRSFVGSGTTPLGPLFENTADINDVLQRDELARVALSAGDIDTDELDAFVSDLEDDREELGDKVEEAEDLAESLKDAEAETKDLTAEYEQARIDAEAELGQLIAEEEARRAAESAARIQAELAAAQQAAQNNSSSSNSGSSNSGSSNSGSSNSGGSSTPAATPAPASTPAASTPVATPPPSSRASVAVSAALSQQGVPYQFARSSPGVAFDCSGLTKYAWGQAGVYLPHQSRAQAASIPAVSRGSAQPGDLLFYHSPISHVGVYLGNNQIVHAPNTGSVVKIVSVNWGKVTAIGRPG
ncbi:MAG: NlpC/P60 family protein [Ilumatobacter sp.]